MTQSEAGLAALILGEHHLLASRYVDLLISRAIPWGLLGPREASRIWSRHLFNSLAIASLVPEGSRLVDVGSGAGLPGIPLAIARPDLEVTLLEPLLRRFTFLTGVVDDLGLDGRVRVLRARAEQHRERYDVVASRALAPLPRLVEWCAPLQDADGMLLALKGATAAEEIATSSDWLAARGLAAELLEVQIHPELDAGRVVRIRRI